MHKYGVSKTTRITIATVHHMTSSSGLRKFQVHGFLFEGVYIKMPAAGQKSILSHPALNSLAARLFFPSPPLSSFLSLLRIVWSLAAVDTGEGGAGA